MDLLLRQLNLNEESSVSSNPEILKCPFLRNIHEPTNFSFTSSVTLPMPACSRAGARGPIFEDGPNFDTAFSLFHGRDGVVPLSGRSSGHSERLEREPALPHFNPLAANAATISLSSFGGAFSFDSFSAKWKNLKRKPEPKKRRNSKHEAMSNEWLANGSCPIAKSYRAVGHVLPLVAKAMQPPPGMKYTCPPAIVAARAALAKTAFAKNLRPQALPTKVLVIGLMGMAANVPLGIWREHTEKFSPAWFAAVHAAVPFIAMLRKSVLMPKSAMAFTIAASILGQVIGSRAERCRLQGVASKRPSRTETPFDESSQLKAVGEKNGHCGDLVEWNPLSLHTAGPTSGVLC